MSTDVDNTIASLQASLLERDKYIADLRGILREDQQATKQQHLRIVQQVEAIRQRDTLLSAGESVVTEMLANLTKDPAEVTAAQRWLRSVAALRD